jgi:hypothetical protein
VNLSSQKKKFRSHDYLMQAGKLSLTNKKRHAAMKVYFTGKVKEK